MKWWDLSTKYSHASAFTVNICKKACGLYLITRTFKLINSIRTRLPNVLSRIFVKLLKSNRLYNVLHGVFLSFNILRPY